MLRCCTFACTSTYTSCYARWSSLALHATLDDLHLHFMLRYMIFTCTSCYATWSSLALHATLDDLHLHFMLRYMIFTCTSFYATWSSLGGGVGWGGVGWDVNVHCDCNHIVRSLALPHLCVSAVGNGDSHMLNMTTCFNCVALKWPSCRQDKSASKKRTPQWK